MDHRLFTILWYAGGGSNGGRVIARDVISRHDLTDAIARACTMLKANQGHHDGYAHGFYVRKHDPSTDPSEVTSR